MPELTFDIAATDNASGVFGDVASAADEATAAINRLMVAVARLREVEMDVETKLADCREIRCSCTQ